MSGFAWEVIIEKASLEVSKHLSSTTAPFASDSITAGHILTLLDVGSFRDIIIERNVNRLCGMIGCAETPLCQRDSTAPRAVHLDETEANDTNDYEKDSDSDDPDGAFRSYRRHTRRTLPSPALPGAAQADRFCSPACAETYASLLARTRARAARGPEELLAAVAGLFPNMRNLSRVRRETGDSCVGIHERDTELTKCEVMAEGGRGGVSVLPRRPSLAAHDWFLTVTTPQTICHVAQAWRRVSGSIAKGKRDALFQGTLYGQCVRSAAKALEATVVDTVTESPAVHPVLQQQRAELLATRVFSPETTATLSRLLLFDHTALEMAWDVWRGQGLLATLSFPFALPGEMFTGGVFELLLALVMAAVSGLCAPVVWAEWVQSDNALAEVLAGIGVTAEELTACIEVLTVV